MLGGLLLRLSDGGATTVFTRGLLVALSVTTDKPYLLMQEDGCDKGKIIPYRLHYQALALFVDVFFILLQGKRFS